MCIIRSESIALLRGKTKRRKIHRKYTGNKSMDERNTGYGIEKGTRTMKLEKQRVERRILSERRRNPCGRGSSLSRVDPPLNVLTSRFPRRSTKRREGTNGLNTQKTVHTATYAQANTLVSGTLGGGIAQPTGKAILAGRAYGIYSQGLIVDITTNGEVSWKIAFSTKRRPWKSGR